MPIFPFKNTSQRVRRLISYLVVILLCVLVIGTTRNLVAGDAGLCVKGSDFLNLKELSDSYLVGNFKNTLKLAPPTIARARQMGLLEEEWPKDSLSNCWQKPISVNVSDLSIVPELTSFIKASGLSEYVQFTDNPEQANFFVSGFGFKGSNYRKGYCIMSRGCLHHFVVSGRTFEDGQVVVNRGLVLFRTGFAFLSQSPLFNLYSSDDLYKKIRFYRPATYPKELDVAITIDGQGAIESGECYYNANLEDVYKVKLITSCLNIIFGF